MKNKIVAAIIAAATLAAPMSYPTPLEVTASAASTAENTAFLAYPVPSRVIYYNPGKLMSGSDVKWLQAAINTVIGTDYAVDGIAGPLTGEEIAAFQRYAGLEVDSCAGPDTIAALQKGLMQGITLASGYNEEYVVDIKNNDSANNTPTQIYPSNGTSAQLFNLRYLGNGYYSIAQASTNKVLDVAGGVTYATWVNLYEYNGTDAQKWRFIPTGEPNKYTIKSALGLTLTVNAIGGSLENTRLCTYARESSRLDAAQTFTIKVANTSVQDHDVNPVADAKDIFVHQTPEHCTAAAASMLLKNYLRIHGSSEWRSINERTIRTSSTSPDDSWRNGLRQSIKFRRPGTSFDGLRMQEYALTGSASEKEAFIKKLLEKHPEGVVLYGTKGGNHAIYMAQNDLILDPYFNDGGRYRPITESINSCSDSYGDITDYWIIL